MDKPRLSPPPTLSTRLRMGLIGALILLVGFAASALLASVWRSSALDANRNAFKSTAKGVSRTLEAKLITNVALIRSLRAIATMEPRIGETRFLEWYRQLQLGVASSPGVVAELIQPVPAARLPAFRRQAEADPAFRALLGGAFRIVPPGTRPVYCLARAIVGPRSGGADAGDHRDRPDAQARCHGSPAGRVEGARGADRGR